MVTATTRRARKAGDPKLAIGYLRVSTDKQHLGPAAQRAQIEAWAEAQSVRIVQWHTDRDTSGGSELEDRPGLVAAINALRAHGAGLLAVARRDRLARSVEVAVALERAVRSAGAAIASADGRNDDDPTSKLVRQIEDAIAEHERELTSGRTRQAMGVLRRRGLYTGGYVPFGFRLDESETAPRSRNGRPCRLVLDPKEQATCAKVMSLHEGGCTITEIVRALRFTHKSRVGHALTEKQIYNIIRLAPDFRKSFPRHARALPTAYACARGHEYDAAMDGKYCVQGDCAEGAGDGSPARRIQPR